MKQISNTKHKLYISFIKLCKLKPFNKIKISDITNNAGVKRQTFYYYFNDKYCLLKHTYYITALHLLDKNVSIDNWQNIVQQMLMAIKKNSILYHKTVTYDQNILFEEFSSILEKKFKELFHLFKINESYIKKKYDENFYALFFSYGCSGILLNWITNNYPTSPKELAEELNHLAKYIEFLSIKLMYHNIQKQ